MSKRKDKRQATKLFSSITQRLAFVPSIADGLSEQEDEDQARVAHRHSATPITDEMLASSTALAQLLTAPDHQVRDLPKMKKFRFQLLHEWMRQRLSQHRRSLR